MQFYKITNEEERHKRMQYKTGLNVDVMPFDPSGDCKPGGIYFAREDIFLFHGPKPFWIREVTIPDNEPVYKNPYHPIKWKAHRVILGERRKISYQIVKELVEEGARIDTLNIGFLTAINHLNDVDLAKYIASKISLAMQT